MSARILSAGLALALAGTACLCESVMAGEEDSNSSKSTQGSGNDPAKNVRRYGSRIGNFKGGHLGASSFGDGFPPGQGPVGANVDASGANGPQGFGQPGFGMPGYGQQGFGQPGTGGQSGSGFLGRYGANGAGPDGTGGQGSDPTNSSISRATIGQGSNSDGTNGDGTPKFPRRVGNTELRQWEIGAGLPTDSAYGYWANWGTNAGLLMEFGWGFPFLGMNTGMPGMPAGPGMMSPNEYGGNIYGPPLGNGYGYGSGGAPGAYGNPASDLSVTRGTSSDDTTGGRANDTRAPGRRPNPPAASPDAPVPHPEAPPFPHPEASSNNDQNAAANTQGNADHGELEFRSGNYKEAAEYWKHSLADDPQNGLLTMMLGQALFAAGEYHESASVTQAAMRLLPEDQWAVVVANRKELYAQPRDYLDQLLALDKLAKEKPKDSSLRFLAGFHYAGLGYPKAALDNLNKGLKLAPHDDLARKLRDKMQASGSATSVPPIPHPPAEESSVTPAAKKSSASR